MKIVILDGFTENPGDLSWDGLRDCGDLTVYDRTPADLTAQRMQGAEAVFTNKTIISAEIMEKCPALKFIGVLATGVNIVDIKAASDRGIVVSNVPAYGTASVAQFTMALLLELCHHVGAHSQAVKNGEWGSCPDFCFWKYPLTELAGKTMGIIGFGNVGRTVARMALAFGMKVLAYIQLGLIRRAGHRMIGGFIYAWGFLHEIEERSIFQNILHAGHIFVARPQVLFKGVKGHHIPFFLFLIHFFSPAFLGSNSSL